MRPIAAPPPKAPVPNYAATLHHFGEALFGKSWVASMARLTGANRRTISRIYAASCAGREYRAARGVLIALNRRLGPITRDLGPWAARAAEDDTDQTCG